MTRGFESHPQCHLDWSGFVLKCPVCGNEWLFNILTKDGYGIACDRCSFIVPPKGRKEPYVEVTQDELEELLSIDKSVPYSYYEETLRYG